MQGRLGRQHRDAFQLHAGGPEGGDVFGGGASASTGPGRDLMATYREN